jgi:hypothetical protein
MPHPQTAKQKRVEARVKELAAKASKRLNISRRRFLEGAGGLAASFIAMNEVYGQNMFNVSEAEMYESDHHASHRPPKDLFVFDDQTHIVRTSNTGGNALRAGAGPRCGLHCRRIYENPFNGVGGGNAAGVDELGGVWTPGIPPSSIRTRAQRRSGTTAGRVPPQPVHQSPVPAGADQRGDRQQRQLRLHPAGRRTVPRAPKEISEPANEILTGWQTAQCRDYINQLAGSTRARRTPASRRGNIAIPSSAITPSGRLRIWRRIRGGLQRSRS